MHEQLHLENKQSDGPNFSSDDTEEEEAKSTTCEFLEKMRERNTEQKPHTNRHERYHKGDDGAKAISPTLDSSELEILVLTCVKSFICTGKCHRIQRRVSCKVVLSHPALCGESLRVNAATFQTIKISAFSFGSRVH